MKIQLFSRQATPNFLFGLHSNYPGDTPCRGWFSLDSSLTRSNRPIFKIPYSRNSKNSVWNPYEIQFFTRQVKAKTPFVIHSTNTGDSKCQVWFNLDNSKTQSITTTVYIRFSRNSQISVRKTNFFRRQAIAKIFFVLLSTYSRYTLFQVWFSLKNFLTQSKITIFNIR